MPWPALALTALGLLAGAGLLYQAIGARRDARRFPPPGTLVTVGTRRLHRLCTGEGTPAVLLEAGIAASSLSWSLVQPQIARFARVCSYDRAGLAWSDAGAARRSLDALVSDLRHVLTACGDPLYILVGHSFGGLVIRAFARAHPAEVAGLVFVDTLHPDEWCAPSPLQRRLLRGGVFLSRVGLVLASFGIVRLLLSRLSGGAPRVPRRVSRLFGPTAAALLERIVGEVRKLPPEVLPSVQAHWSRPKAFRGLAQHLSALPGCSAAFSGRDAPLDDLPLVVLSAATRPPRWLDADRQLAGRSPRGRHWVSRTAGHWILLDDAGLVADAVASIRRSLG